MVGTLSATMLSSCNAKQDEHGLDAENPITINIWHYYNGIQQSKFDELVNEFNETVGYEKGIILETEASSSISELADSVVASMEGQVGAEEPPNIFASYLETAYIIDKMGYVADMKPYFTDEELSEYVDDYLQEGILGNEDSLKIFPVAKSTEVMILNLTDWQPFADATGVTTDDLTTWEDLNSVAEKYYNYTDALTPDVPNDGKAFFGRDSTANYMVIGAKQLGYEYVTIDGDTVQPYFDETALRRLWDNYYVPYVKGYYTAQSKFRSDDAKIGNIIALIGSTTSSVYYPTSVTINDDYTYPIESLVLPIPNFKDTDPYIVQQGAGFVVKKADEKTEYACSVFLKWFTDVQRNIDFSIGSGYLPVKKDANDYDTIMDINSKSSQPMEDILVSTIDVALNEISHSKLYTNRPYNHSDTVRNLLEEAISDEAKATYEEAWNKINSGQDYNKVIEEYTNDDAFNQWLENFKTNLTETVTAE